MAGGSGIRCGGALPKQFALLGGMPVLARTINAVAAALPGAEFTLTDAAGTVVGTAVSDADGRLQFRGADWRRSAPTRN